MGKLSFSIAINLLTDNFKKGANTVKSTIRSMQMRFLAFAATLGAGGLGLEGFVSRMIETARETSRAITALKNISGSTAIFADSQKFLIDLAKKYGLEINSLTSNFAKFSASASATGVVMDDQKKIFESLSRAATAYGMSSEDANLMFMAVQQMMSKGKISSEELRRQLGERLPVAMAAMAKAAGVPISQLDKLLKDGKLLSNEVLPKFADALNEMIPNVSTDNLETSINRLKNTFTEFVTGSGAAEKYKALIDGLTQIVQYGANNIRTIVTYLVAGLLVLITSKFVTKILGALKSAEVAARRSAIAAARAAGVAFDRTAWEAQRASAKIKVAFERAAASVKAALISAIPTAIIAIIGALVAKMYSVYQESKRIDNIFKDYKDRINSPDVSQESARLSALQSEYNKINNSLSTKKTILSEINGILGTSLTVNQDVNKVISERIKLLESSARAELAAQEAAQAQSQTSKLGKKTYNGRTIAELAPEWAIARGDNVKESRFSAKFGVSFGNGFSENDLRNDLNSFIEYANILKDAKGRIAKEVISNQNTDTNGGGGDTTKKKSELQKQQESYAEKLSQLNTELELGLKTQNEHNQALGELNINMYSDAKASGDKKVLESKYYKNLKLAAENAVKNQEKNKGLIELDKIQKEYNDSVLSARKQQEKGYISQEELNAKIQELAVEAGRSAAGIKGIDDAAETFIATMSISASLLQSPINQKPRDTTFDYKKNAVDIAEEELSRAKELANKYKEAAVKAGKSLSDELSNAIANVPALEDKLKIAQVKQDVKDLTKELNSELYSGIKDIASSSDRVVNAFQNLNEVMGSVDSSGWEKIMALWNGMTTIVDSFLSVIELIKNITEITNKLTKAKEAEAVVDTTTTGVKVANAAIGAGADIAASEVKKDTAMTNIAANTAEGASESGKSAAKLPFPWNIVAIGGAIAASLALFASIPKFKTGGIFTGGTSSGDKGLARLNSGEMILNMTQQSKLFNAINSGNIGNSGKVISTSLTSRVRGKDLLLTINNELKSQGKKTL